MEQFRDCPIFKDVSRDIVIRFEKFHHNNPSVFDLFKLYAEQIQDAGVERSGAKSIMERLRWDYNFETVDEPFKISNSYTSMYARLLILKHSKFKNFFTIKNGPYRGATENDERIN